MKFNSITFLLFIAVFFLVWPLVAPRKHLRWIYLTFSSFIFYGWWDWRFIFLLLGSGLLDFYAAIGMYRHPRFRKLFLICSLFGNLGTLVVFKYLYFITYSLQNYFSYIGATTLAEFVPIIKLTLPIGISFYTFQSLSYTIDVYRKRLSPTPHLFHFFAYLSMFPQLVAGPIVRAAQLLPQLSEWNRPNEQERWNGLKLIVQGYFKKVVLADNFAVAIDMAFNSHYPVQSGPYWWVVITMFAFQIYFDFSGYTDIARGLANWMGYKFPLNFNHPYLANSFRDFWKRWHISLSTWFRDYLYIPLGGSRSGPHQIQWNLWITMLLAGLWHGASWTFVCWGALHAFYLHIERRTNWPVRIAKVYAGQFFVSILLLGQVWIAWVFFRAKSFGQALDIIFILFNPVKWNFFPVWTLGRPRLFLLGIAIFWEAHYFLRKSRTTLVDDRLQRILEPVLISLMILSCVYFRGPGQAFIYFQF